MAGRRRVIRACAYLWRRNGANRHRGHRKPAEAGCTKLAYHFLACSFLTRPMAAQGHVVSCCDCRRDVPGSKAASRVKKIVSLAQQPHVPRVGGARSRIRLDVVEFEKRPRSAASTSAGDERALTAVPTASFSSHRDG